MAKEEIAAWTIMVYPAGDNNLTFALTKMSPANKSIYEYISDRSPRNGIADRRMLFKGDKSKRKVVEPFPTQIQPGRRSRRSNFRPGVIA